MPSIVVPRFVERYTSDAETSSGSSLGGDSDIEDVPSAKHKVPLNHQFKAASPCATAVDIDWVPSLPKYLERVSRQLKAGLPHVELPQGFPSSIHSDSCWSGEDFKADNLVTTLTSSHVEEVERALHRFKDLGLSKNDISPQTFPLPTLSTVLNQISIQVHRGVGVSILRGLQPANYALEDNVIIYAGIASYVGQVRGKQDNDGNILVHIKDVGAAVAPDNLRQSPYANNAQPFHNDLGDIIALYCIEKAMSGGVSRLASAAKVYNEIAEHRPDLIHELTTPHWAFDHHDGHQSYHERPILFNDTSSGKTFFCFSRRQLTGSAVAPRPSYLPPLTEAQAEALDAVHFTADKHAIRVQLEKGDIQFSNNLALFHAREAFTDGVDSHKRHLIRMWLRNEELAWPTPPELREAWKEIYGDHHDAVWFMSPTHERAHVINRTKSCHG